MPGTTTYYPVSQEANAGTLTPEPMVKATVPQVGENYSQLPVIHIYLLYNQHPDYSTRVWVEPPSCISLRQDNTVGGSRTRLQTQDSPTTRLWLFS